MWIRYTSVFYPVVVLNELNRTFKMKRNLLLIITISFLLVGCECAADYEYSVINQTSDTVKIDYYSEGEESVIVLRPTEIIKLSIAQEVSRCGCNNCDAKRLKTGDSTIWFITLNNVVIRDSVESKTNFNKEFNWDFESKDKLGKYTLRIDNSDF